MLLLPGCAPTSPAPPVATSSVTTTANRSTQVRPVLDALSRAARAADRPGFTALTSDRDPSFASRVRLLYDNLSTLPLAELSFAAEPGEHALTPARQAVLGADAWVQPVVVTWRLTADDRPAQHRVWLTFAPEAGEPRLAGTFDGPADDPPRQQPSWWRGPLTARSQDGVTVLAGSGQPVDRWLREVGVAVADVQRDLPAGVAPRWSGEVVVEVPASVTDFAAVIGRPVERADEIAGVAQQVGDGSQPPLRVVVNPRIRTQTDTELRAGTLRHEIVHVATRSPESPAPEWAVEGMAEWVDRRGRTVGDDVGIARLLAAVREDGAPRSLPTDGEFAGGGPDVSRAYAEAWFICRFVAETYSPDRLGRLYAALDQGRSVDEAAESALGLSAAELTAGWRRFLVQQARIR